jgi:hypothetical protein
MKRRYKNPRDLDFFRLNSREFWRFGASTLRVQRKSSRHRIEVSWKGLPTFELHTVQRLCKIR